MKTYPETLHIIIPVDDSEVELEVLGTFTPARSMTRCAYGWEPPEPESFDVEEIRI